MTTWLQRWWRDASSVDLRALAAMRVALGVVLVADLALRLCDLGAFYTDGGVLPRATLMGLAEFSRPSLLLVSGGPMWSGAIIAAAGLAALAFTIGWRTRTAALVLFVLLASIQARNPVILIGGDIQIMALLLWALFLPLGARFSVDAAVAHTPPPRSGRYRSIAAFALLVQIVSVYFFSAILKDGDAWWPDGTAVYYALELDRYTTDIGRWLQQYPSLTRPLAHGVWFLEWAAPLLVFAPVFMHGLRTTAWVLLSLMHIGFLLCLELGHFPWVSLAALLALTPPKLWHAARRALDRNATARRRTRIYYDRDCGFCLASCHLLRVFLVVPRARIAPAQDTPRAQRLMDAHWSWVVIDGDNTAHLKYEAFVALLRASLLFRWMAPLAARPWAIRAGDALYDAVAAQRGTIAALTRWLWQPRPVRWRPGTAAHGVAGAALVAVTAWNAHTVGWLPAPALQPIAPLMQALRIDQRWDMFAPEPSRTDGWIVLPGTLEDGRDIDLRAADRVLDWQRPDPPNAHRNVRWHSYEWRLLALREESLFLAYGRHLCRRFNADRAPGTRLERFDLVYVVETSPPPGGRATLERRTAWHHRCLP